jgi:hypothetical protein
MEEEGKSAGVYPWGAPFFLENQAFPAQIL